MIPITREDVRRYLEATFPGGPEGRGEAVDDRLLDLFLQAQASAALGLVASSPPVALPADRASLPPTFLARGRHWRLGVEDFVSDLPLVRVTLPAEATGYRHETPWGVVDAADHFLRDLRDVTAKAGKERRPGRVEMYTTTRTETGRFNPLAVLVAFREPESQEPWYYLIEAGMPAGTPRVLYVAPDMGPMVRQTAYQATPFTDVNNFYRFTLEMAGPVPAVLKVDAYPVDSRLDPGRAPLVQVEMRVEPVPPEDPRLSVRAIDLYREAAARVAAIAEALGVHILDLSILQGILARDGRRLPWLYAPGEYPGAG